MDIVGTVISCLLGVIAVLLGILYGSATKIVESLNTLKEDFREYKSKQGDHERRLEQIEKRCMVHSGELKDLLISVAEMKPHGP